MQRCLAHLLWCGECQERVEEERAFAQATRNAALLLESEQATERDEVPATGCGWGRRISVRLGGPLATRWMTVTASACVLLALGVLVPLRLNTKSGDEVWLRSERGIAATATVESNAGGHLRIRIDTAEVAAFSSYTVAVVDSVGRELETKSVAASAASVGFEVERALAPGRYWVRLSAPNGPLLREYALQVH